MAGDEKEILKKMWTFKVFNRKYVRKVEGINLQDEEFDPGGPLFRRKKKKIAKRGSLRRGYPLILFWNKLDFGKKSRKTILILHM